MTANLLSGATFSNVQLQSFATPEPASLALAGIGLIGLALGAGRAALEKIA